MKADLTRSSFDPLNNFSRVLMQQGRVQLDADWNEQADILLYALRRFIADASHELKTPLTIIKGNTSLALSGGIAPDGYQESMAEIDMAAQFGYVKTRFNVADIVDQSLIHEYRQGKR